MATPHFDHLLTNVRLVTCVGAPGATGEASLGIIEDGAVGVVGGRVAWTGKSEDLKFAVTRDRLSLPGAMVLPGFVDAHTHLVFAGSRIDEFSRKMAGEDYRAIAASGGGIASTVRATRAASEDDLFESAKRRALSMRALGTTTVEVKGGYGLSTEHEVRLLRVARRLAKEDVIETRTTFLGAHAVPKEFEGRRDAYVDEIVNVMIPAVLAAGLADACDAYIDDGAFTVEEARRVFTAAKAGGLRVKGHVGQFKDVGGAELLAEFSALSGDHLEDVGDAGIAAMAKANVPGVLLPAAWSTLRQKAPDAARFRRAGVPLAVATDCNPGTSPCLDLPLCAALAVRDAGLTAEEAVLGITRHAAAALGLSDVGTITVGAKANFVVYPHNDPRVIAYALGNLRPSMVLGWANPTPWAEHSYHAAHW